MADVRGILTEIDQSTDWPGLQRVGETAASLVLPSLFPMAGATSLLRYGPRVLPPVLRQVGGALAGTGVNQATGLTPPGVPEFLWQAATPMSARGLGIGGRVAGKFGSEARGAETLNQIIPKELRMMQAQYQPPIASRDLFKKLEGTTEHLPAPATKQAAKDELTNIGKSVPGFQESYRTLAKQLKGVHGATKQTGWLPLETYQRLLHDVGTHIQAAERAGGVEAKGYKSLYRALMDDLEQAPQRTSGTTAETLARAREAFKREKVLEELSQLAKPFTKRGTDIEQTNVNKLLNRLNDPQDVLAKNFQSAFSAQEQARMMSRLNTLNKMPMVPPGAGQTFGSGSFWKHEFPAMASGSGMGYAAGGGPGAALGLTLGAAIPPASRMIRDFSLAWNTDTGRAMIGEMIRNNGGRFSPEMWAAIEAFAAAQGSAPEALLFQRTP